MHCPRSTMAMFLLGLLGSLAVRADWQYTKWGMTPEQVIAASRGAATLTTADERVAESPTNGSGDALAKALYRAGESQFDAYFLFKANRLVSVRLDLKDPTPISSGVVRRALQLKYGEPISQTQTSGFSTVTWRAADEQVTFMLLGDGKSTSVHYQALHTADNAGL
jgi:hypothetical protein